MSRRNTRKILALVFVLLAVPAIGDQASPVASQPSPEDLAFFEKKIRPVLVENCYKCHSAESKKIRGELRVDTAASLLKGGESNQPAVVPGHPDQSKLLQAINYTDEDLQMPPTAKLDDSVIADIVTWINMGAPFPEETTTSAPADAHQEIDIETARQFWSFQPPKTTPLPNVQRTDWPLSPIDFYVLAKLEEKNLAPSPPADKRTLIRRITFDLIGLPPTPEEVDAFLADESPDSFAKVVERLLASPHYGERWGRHWLDVVRYADTAGDSADYPVPELFRYRNYVIDAFNKDKPYDRFIREQIAGDLLPTETREQKYEQIIATGFIGVSRKFNVQPDNTMFLTIEDTIDAVGRSMAGLTVSCARCHDHKYDPISEEDYYALYGIFNSTRYPYAGSEMYRRQRDLVNLMTDEEVEALLAPYGETYAYLNAEVDRLFKERKRTLVLEQMAATQPEGSRPVVKPSSEELAEQLKKAEKRRDEYQAKMPVIPKAFAVAEGKPGDARIQKRGQPKNLGEVAPRGFLQVLGGQKLPENYQGSGRLELAQWLTQPSNPLAARVMVNRIWQYHFGKGIVQTPSDFGARGKRPTHPELLDYLAIRFMESGWSVKAMHRLMVLSRTYQMAASYNPAFAEADANNDYLWHFPRRRLSAEEVRDSMLAVSGTLDRSMAGEHPFPKEYDRDYTQHFPFSAVYESKHRSVYVMQQRFKKHPFFSLFDGADTNSSTADRPVTITPLQALYFMNNPFVAEQADAFARQLMSARSNEVDQIDLAYRMALGRAASSDEQTEALQYLREYGEKLKATTQPASEHASAALASYVRVLMDSNEFMFVD